MKVRVSVQLKPGILDPQGKAVEQGLHGFGFEVEHVRIGRLIEMDVPGTDPADVKARSEIIQDLGDDLKKYTKVWDEVKAAP